MKAKDEAVTLVKEFVEINDKRRKRSLSTDEIERWYVLKQKIEMVLFSNPPVTSEKRRSVRIQNLKIPVNYDNGIERCHATVRELSEGGLFIATDEPLPVATQIDLLIETRDMQGFDGEELKIQARVLYTNVGHSFGERAFSGMGMVLSETLAPPMRQSWQQLFDHLLAQAAGQI